MDRFHIPGFSKADVAVVGFNFCMVNGNYRNIVFAFPFGHSIFMTFQKMDKMRD